ncbi:MAG: hypothetical protein AAF581_19245 [Planctomycetota bacterium]
MLRAPAIFGLAVALSFGGAVFEIANPWRHVANAAAGDLITELPFPGLAPQGITFDPTDGSYWVTSFLDGDIKHFDSQLQWIGSIPDPFTGSEEVTGIAYHPSNDTLFVMLSDTFEVREIDKTGTPFAPPFWLQVLPVQNFGGPRGRGMAFHAAGNGGLGSLYVVETVASLIYEFDRQGNLIRSFSHPDDPDGYPGNGAGADAGGIELVLDATGALLGFDLIGAVAGAPVIHRLDATGTATGLTTPLTAVGAGTGGVGGLLRTTFVDASGTVHDAFVGTAESSPALFVVDAQLPPVAQILALDCTANGTTIDLTWSTGQNYDDIEVRRNGDPYALLPGTQTSFADTNLPPGVYRYELVGRVGTELTTAIECTRVVGAGQVQAVGPIDGVRWAIDLTEDGSGNLWVTDGENQLHCYSKDLNFIRSIPGPFPPPTLVPAPPVPTDDFLSAVAYNPGNDTLFAYNAFDQSVREIDLFGTPVAPPFSAQIPIPASEDLFVGGLVFDPAGNSGNGSLILAESARGMIYEIALDGALLLQYPHPDEVRVPAPDPSVFDTHVLGISGVPEIGNGYAELDLAGGTLFERTTDRFFRVQRSTGTPTAFRMPTDGIAAVASRRFLAIHNSTYNNQPVAFVISVRSNDNMLLRVDRTLPPVPEVSVLECRQTGLDDEVLLSFLNHGPYDTIEVDRDGVVIATLPGNATSYVDTTAAPGWHRYRLTATTAGVASAPRECELRVGRGAILRRAITWPGVSPYQMTRNPVDGSFYVTVNTPILSESVFQYDANMQYIGPVAGPAEVPWQPAAIAIRPVPGSHELWSISWEVPAPWMMAQSFDLAAQDPAGAFVFGPQQLTIPGPPVGTFVTYPTGLTHDTGSDTFWFLERNDRTIWQMDLSGTLLASFPHPAPPLQDFVFNLGLSFDADRNAFTATSAGPLDLIITKTVAFTRDGVLIPEEIPLDAVPLSNYHGLARDDNRVWISGSNGSLPLLFEVKAADAIARPATLTCSTPAANQVELTWTEPSVVASVVVQRDGVTIATVPGGTLTYTDSSVSTGTHAYTIASTDGTRVSAPVACAIDVAGVGQLFVRGDSNNSAGVDLTDAIYLLAYLFNSGTAPQCEDSADCDDDGSINVTDAVYLLTYLFNQGTPPPPPFPNAGTDPTVDTLSCL